MNDLAPSTAVHALPDGEAEVSLVLRLRWEDVATLGRDAGRLAGRLRRPVSLDEAVSHRLRGDASFPAAAIDGSRRSAGLPATAFGARPTADAAGEAAVGRLAGAPQNLSPAPPHTVPDASGGSAPDAAEAPRASPR
ncbi:hypothetical protein [Streptomyces sp. NPDC090029]|uniref:hypothetical protein n=1 Tax=Streptomyces sp. NPDC090029 TaxID=3365924 RepID=UPI0038002CE3